MTSGAKRKANGNGAGGDESYLLDWRSEERRPFRRGFIAYGPCSVPKAVAAKRRKKMGIGVVDDPAGDEITPMPLESFEGTGAVPGWLIEGIRDAGRFEPTPIEAQCFPIVLAGQNLIAVVGSGATRDTARNVGAAYLAPAMVHAEDQDALEEEDPGPIVVVLAPDPSLCARIAEEATALLVNSNLSARHPDGVRAVDVSGGGTRSEKLKQLGACGAHVVVGTPKRVHDMATKEQISLLRVTLLVLDGADRLLDEVTVKEVKELSKWIRPERQMVLVSGTWPRQLHQLAGDLCYASGLPVRVNFSAPEGGAKQIAKAKPKGKPKAKPAAKAPANKAPLAKQAPVDEEAELDDGEEVVLEEEVDEGEAVGEDAAGDEALADDWEAALAE